MSKSGKGNAASSRSREVKKAASTHHKKQPPLVDSGVSGFQRMFGAQIARDRAAGSIKESLRFPICVI